MTGFLRDILGWTIGLIVLVAIWSIMNPQQGENLIKFLEQHSPFGNAPAEIAGAVAGDCAYLRFLNVAEFERKLAYAPFEVQIAVGTSQLQLGMTSFLQKDAGGTIAEQEAQDCAAMKQVVKLVMDLE
jgi:hypothetical protein